MATFSTFSSSLNSFNNKNHDLNITLRLRKYEKDIEEVTKLAKKEREILFFFLNYPLFFVFFSYLSV